MATYDEILKQIQDARKDLGGDSIKINEESPAYEALVGAYAPELAKIGTTAIPQQGPLLPQVAGQTQLQQKAAEMQARQAGLLGENQNMVFNQSTGTFELPTGASGVAGYQQYLDGATSAAAAQEGLMYNADGSLKDAAGQTATNNASIYGDLAGQAAIQGQGASDSYTQAAQGYVGPNAYQQFMSPYQQEIIDATQADMANQLAEQQAQLGASAGNAFGGGRFGVAQGQLASSGALGSALAAAQLRTAGYTNAQQAAAQAYTQEMGMGSQAMQQAQQNQGMLTQAQQNQLATANAQNQQVSTQLQQLAGVGQTQQGLATLQPQLAAQQIGAIGQLGAQQQGQAQTILDTARAAARQIAYEPRERLSFMGSQLTGLKGGYPGAQYSSAPQPGTSPTAGIVSLLTGGAGLATGIAGMMNPSPYPGFG